MCRLLGIYGRVAFWQEIAMGFRQQAEFGNIPPGEPVEPGHKDGWGMAVSNPDQTAMVPVQRKLGSAYRSPSYRQAVYAITHPPTVFLCHLRKASPKVAITLSNVHPFFSNGWAMIHNGTIFQAETLPREPSLRLTSDGSDTEYFFHYLLTGLLAKHTKGTELAILAEAVASCAADYTALNSLLSEGANLFVIRNYRKYADYYTLYYYVLPEGVIVCSEPLESRHLNPVQWESLPNQSLLRIHGSPPQIDAI
ncbi:MAG: class II glutamine amidotransferase [Desulfobacterales bacterium]|nr:MAG: class II glutamine amidotransferase [Desulfobacterales bacterium]